MTDWSELLSRLKNQYPNADIDRIAEETLKISAIRNPEAFLISKVREAETAGTCRVGERPETPKKQWGFRLDGSLAEDGSHNDHFTAWVRSLIAVRRSSQASPADLLSQVKAGPDSRYGAILGVKTLESWAGLEDFLDWPAVFSATAAAESVKRCGVANGYWDRGHWRTKR